MCTVPGGLYFHSVPLANLFDMANKITADTVRDVHNKSNSLENIVARLTAAVRIMKPAEYSSSQSVDGTCRYLHPITTELHKRITAERKAIVPYVHDLRPMNMNAYNMGNHRCTCIIQYKIYMDQDSPLILKFVDITTVEQFSSSRQTILGNTKFARLKIVPDR